MDSNTIKQVLLWKLFRQNDIQYISRNTMNSKKDLTSSQISLQGAKLPNWSTFHDKLLSMFHLVSPRQLICSWKEFVTESFSDKVDRHVNVGLWKDRLLLFHIHLQVLLNYTIQLCIKCNTLVKDVIPKHVSFITVLKGRIHMKPTYKGFTDFLMVLLQLRGDQKLITHE